MRDGAGRNQGRGLFKDSEIEGKYETAGKRRTVIRPQGKYGPLAWHLGQQRGTECILDFSEIEMIIGSHLPKSARARRTGWLWWSNDVSRTQARHGWLAAGWQVSHVDYAKGVVCLRYVVPDQAGGRSKH